MTNAEKFREVFGFVPDEKDCPIPVKACEEFRDCNECIFGKWWSREYKECFELKEEYE